MERLTYKSPYGDYGLEKEFASTSEEIHALRNALGKYEDTDMTPEECAVMKKLKELYDNGELVRRSNEDKIRNLSTQKLAKSLECCASDDCGSCPAFAPDMRDNCEGNIKVEAADRLMYYYWRKVK